MTEAAFLIPGELSAPTGGYAYARAILPRLATGETRLRPVALPAAYPAPAADDLAETARIVAALPQGAALLIDGLAYGAMPRALIDGFDRPIVALVHHPLGYETGLSAERARSLIDSERAALAQARRVVATSPTTARALAQDFGVAADRLSVAAPGVSRQPRAVGTGSPVALVAVGALSPRKGYDVLITALDGLARHDWRLTIVGADDRDPATAQALRDRIAASCARKKITLAGALDDAALDATMTRADVFVMSSLYEGYGMALAEGLARGLAIVSTTGGALAETAPDDAALKVPPGDAAALREALAAVIGDAGLRRRLADAAWARAPSLPDWDDAARIVALAIDAAIKETRR